MSSDDPAMRLHPMLALKWNSSEQSHVVAPTWSLPVGTVDAEAATARQIAVEETVVAFFSLAGCTHSIIAPVGSAFSMVAAAIGGVPLRRCCGI